jgi:hypothetical protein
MECRVQIPKGHVSGTVWVVVAEGRLQAVQLQPIQQLVGALRPPALDTDGGDRGAARVPPACDTIPPLCVRVGSPAASPRPTP